MDAGASRARASGSRAFRSLLLWRSYLIAFILVAVAVAIGGWRGALGGAGLGGGVIYWNVRTVLSPMSAIARAAQAVSQGSFGHRLQANEFDESALSRIGQ